MRKKIFFVVILVASLIGLFSSCRALDNLSLFDALFDAENMQKLDEYKKQEKMRTTHIDTVKTENPSLQKWKIN